MPYTARLANPNARPGNIKLGMSFIATVKVLPSIDLPTTISLHPHASSLAVEAHRSTLTVNNRITTVVFD